MEQIPIFALGTVLFPGGELSLRVFETRYVDMVRECMRAQQVFGVACIREGSEVGAAPKIHDVATSARISDFDRLDDGLLGITADGERRFRIVQTHTETNQLVRAVRIEWLTPDTPSQVPEAYAHLCTVVEKIYQTLQRSMPQDASSDASWIANRIAEVLPVPLLRKQQLLELEDPIVRLREVDEIVQRLAEA
jgi:uncharacterized protein